MNKNLTNSILGAIIAISTTISLDANADTRFYVKGKEGTKADAIRALLMDPKAEVTKCDDQELTNKATLRKK